MRLARRAVAAALAALVVWPTVAVAQDPVPEPESESESESDTGSDTQAERAMCAEAPTVFDLLCGGYELLKARYVDEIGDEDLAAAAARGVHEAGLALRSEEDEAAPPCALPAPAFEQTCIAIDAARDTPAAVWAASKEMFAFLGDRNTFLMSRSEYEALLSRLDRGTPYSGIGLSLGLLDGTVPCELLSETCRPVVAEVYAGSPAERAGLMADDIVLSFDDFVPSGSGCGIGGLPSFDPGRRVRVRVERDGREMSFMVEAELVQVPSADSRTVAGKTGYLRLGGFGARSDRALARELQTLLNSGIENLVVDLRGNPGGYLQTVINISSMFLDAREVVVQAVSRFDTVWHRVSGHGGFLNPVALPVAFAVDGGSASASEVLTLALRDHGLATVVGTATFGKNTGQITQAIRSRNGALLGGARVTVFRWLGPDGVSAAGGIEPDVELDLSGCWHPIGLTRQVAAAAGLPGAAPADLDLGTERFDAVEALTVDGVLGDTGCGPGLFCPGDPIPRWMMAVWLVRVVDGHDPEPAGASRFVDVDASQWWATHVERLADLGITVGCVSEPAQYCPDDPVTRAQMATFLNRAFHLDPAIPSGFDDTDGSVHEAAIDALHAAGITQGCSAEPLRFCPDRATTRGQMALFLERARNPFG